MISDKPLYVRELAWKRYKKWKAEQYEDAAEEQVVTRKFVVSELNLECDDYTNILIWSKISVTESPITGALPDNIIQYNVESREVSFFKSSLHIHKLLGELFN